MTTTTRNPDLKALGDPEFEAALAAGDVSAWHVLKVAMDLADPPEVHGYVIRNSEGGCLSIELLWWDAPGPDSPEPIVIANFLVEGIRRVFENLRNNPDWEGVSPATMTPATWSRARGVQLTGEQTPWNI